MSQYLSAQVGGFLPPFGNNEGQGVPTVKDMMRRTPWREDQEFDWNYIRAQWESLASDKLFVEASPPNLIRVHQIEPVFGGDSSALISICDPYQHIASSMRRYSSTPDHVARQWIFKARAIRQIREDYPHFLFISYEEFVRNPSAINQKFGVPYRAKKVSGKKGSGIDGIASAYCRGVGFFRFDEVAAATDVLESAADVLEYFGYGLAGPKFLDDAQERNPEEFGVGLARREAWDQRQTSAT